MPGHYPVQRTVGLIPTAADNSVGAMIEASGVASRLNNRLYRQCRNYRLKLKYGRSASNDPGRIEIYTLPDTWFVHGAVKYAFKTYMQNHADELANGVKFGAWHDFKVNAQNPDGVYEVLNPCQWDGDGFGTLAADEAATDSTTKDGSGTSRGFHIIGNLNNSYNIFREYAELLNNRKPDDESTTAVQPYGDLLDLKDAEAMVESGDRAPYDRDFSSMIPDDETVDETQGQHILCLQDILVFDQDGGSGKQSSAFFNAPLGIVFLRVLNYAGNALDLSPTAGSDLMLEFAKGDYKGIHAPSMV